MRIIVKILLFVAGLGAFVLLSHIRYLYDSYYMRFDQFQHVQILTDITHRGYPAASMPPSRRWWYNVPANEIPFSKMKFLAAFILMIPNMITTIGGAEATGFATHCHWFYMGAAVCWEL